MWIKKNVCLPHEKIDNSGLPTPKDKTESKHCIHPQKNHKTLNLSKHQKSILKD